jgi:tRNA A37 methylthiotransferase MiaB
VGREGGGGCEVGACAGGGTYYVETYGCQMNVSDSEIVKAILEGQGWSEAARVEEADAVLLNTCSIRENAEQRVWGRLASLRGAEKRPDAVVAVLGCMAERLKTRVLEQERVVDVVAGPDAYRDLPRLLSAARGGASGGVNVQLSTEETYADIAPVRRRAGDKADAFVSIMRGCNNMCAFCVVPFTRGRERSRPPASVLDEVRRLADEGFREIVLLGQNVNSYRFLPKDGAGGGDGGDGGREMESGEKESGEKESGEKESEKKRSEDDYQNPNHLNAASKPLVFERTSRFAGSQYEVADGFGNLYRRKVDDGGVGFVELLDRISAAIPHVRVRFTSPHPKDFPSDLLHLIAERPNLAKQLHLPAQSGATSTLERMRRLYSREAYLSLAERARAIIPGVALSTDMIAGFCGETEEEHRESVSLMELVRFEQAFLFAYSMREKTMAHRRMQDDVPQDVKLRRLQELIAVFLRGAHQRNLADVGSTQLVLVEGPAKRDPGALQGRSDHNKRVVFPKTTLPDGRTPQPGDFVVCRVRQAGVKSLQADALAISSIQEFASSSSAKFGAVPFESSLASGAAVGAPHTRPLTQAL